ncbi:subclass B3 metallo-beta-lactamase [Croceicoccus ponticola]|uniref:Subclass B3 metallo-beta-lactamase n=1 Tax=Croceicoccus ponticola TaxID=2217664 RepID=A0A437H1T5_9SPHN|nr:subclass B3 metallo-beta-lactamase [Croceicoccus ponticola]RVQ69473.1 subclass B3 metallo-beta-lactamase [Croceicoccus ponticola]
MTQSPKSPTPRRTLTRTTFARTVCAPILASGALIMLAACVQTGGADAVGGEQDVVPALAPAAAYADECADWDVWDKPGPPFRVFGNTHYVGTCGISAVLVTGDKGHVLIDTGTEAGADAVLANVDRLGFAPGDIRILLISHEHHDHVGGAAQVAERTRARVMAGEVAAKVLTSGNVGPDDPHYGIHPDMTPVAAIETIAVDQPVTLGNLALRMVPTPGHTNGAVSWQWRSCEGTACRTIVYADSLTPVSRDDYRFSDHPDYVAAFRQSIAAVAALDCHILLTPHPSASAMRERIVGGSLARPGSCRAYAEQATIALDSRLAKEAAQ